ncbi:uncharacterized protein LOC115694447 [Syzygium oleosum]|uniref:uncharacterized protein LOC115694447 n=1 Tax=Syzygium oleosum TaxID=219896 RepID=UPI0024BA553C|nr:uncharacterized protein LOC115694447 [Syzygium oleosum]
MEASQDSNAEIVSVVDALKPRSSPTDDPSHPEVKEGDLLGKNPISEETLVELEKNMSEMNCRILEETVVELEKKISELNCQIKSHEGESEMNMFWNPLYEDSGFNMSWNKLYKIKD